jgi:hypothetical protein
VGRTLANHRGKLPRLTLPTEPRKTGATRTIGLSYEVVQRFRLLLALRASTNFALQSSVDIATPGSACSTLSVLRLFHLFALFTVPWLAFFAVNGKCHCRNP